MKPFETFGEYMFHLLFAPLKSGKRAVNQFWIFFRVIGREFDELKAAFFRLREEANAASASELMLNVHGQDRGMARIAGEDAESYRRRLVMQGVVSTWGGTKKGILYALASMGWDRSYIEPAATQDPERWAEFVVYLGSSSESSIPSLEAIDAQIRKVKEASSRPDYGLEERKVIEIRNASRAGMFEYRICGRFRCGQKLKREEQA